MGTSLSLSYLGYQSSDVRLFDQSEPFVPEGAAPQTEESGLEEVPAAAAAGDAAAPAQAAGDGALVEVPSEAAATDTVGSAEATAPTNDAAPSAAPVETSAAPTDDGAAPSAAAPPTAAKAPAANQP